VPRFQRCRSGQSYGKDAFVDVGFGSKKGVSQRFEAAPGRRSRSFSFIAVAFPLCLSRQEARRWAAFVAPPVGERF